MTFTHIRCEKQSGIKHFWYKTALFYIVALPRVALCAFEITLLQAITLTLLLVCAFSPRKYKSFLRGLRLLRSYICFVVFLTSSKLYFGWRRSDILAIAKVAVNPQRAHVALCAFEITLSRAITLTLLLVCAFSPRVHSIPRGPLFPLAMT